MKTDALREQVANAMLLPQTHRRVSAVVDVVEAHVLTEIAVRDSYLNFVEAGVIAREEKLRAAIEAGEIGTTGDILAILDDKGSKR